ncbi:MAG: hypothetical protein K2N00_05275, partial [Lachnospiraceae bacterium]|nr:hypothetical protein [Lachnospiraceae bacterium]
MDTKWKKCKVLCSFVAFAAGMTLVLTNLTLAVCAYLPLAGQDLTKPADYQETEQFRYIIEERLNSLLGVATGGSGWYTGLDSGVYIQHGYDGGLAGWMDRKLNARSALVEAEANEATEVVVEESADAVPVTQEAYFEEAPAYYINTYEDHLRELYGSEAYSQEELAQTYYLQKMGDLYGDDFADNLANGYFGSNQRIYFDENGNVDREKT